MKRIFLLSFMPAVPYPPLRGTFPSRGRLFIVSGEVATTISNFSCKRGFHLKPRDGTPQRLPHKFESRDEWLVARD